MGAGLSCEHALPDCRGAMLPLAQGNLGYKCYKQLIYNKIAKLLCS